MKDDGGGRGESLRRYSMAIVDDEEELLGSVKSVLGFYAFSCNVNPPCSCSTGTFMDYDRYDVSLSLFLFASLSAYILS